MKLSEAAQALQTVHHGEDITFTGCCTDSRRVIPGSLFIALKGAHFDGHDFIISAYESGASASLTEIDDPDFSPMIVVDNTLRAMGSLASSWRERFDIPLVAITGSNGKTTVKEMLLSILQRQAPVLATQGNLNNEIGVPLTLFGMDNEHAYAIVEMGANHAGEIARMTRIARPTVALITQCAPAHLEGFGSIEGVARAKSEIYDGLDDKGIAIINADDDFAGFWSDYTGTLRQLRFGLEQEADINARSIRSTDKGMRFDLCLPGNEFTVDLPLPGRHNIANALAAAACAYALNIEPALIRSGLERMTGVKGRLEKRHGINRSTLLDDTYNANPASLRAALDYLKDCPGEHWLVLGDMGELGEADRSLHAAAGEQSRKSGVEHLFTIGELSRSASEAFGNKARHYEDIDSLIADLRSEIRPSVTLLVKASRAMRLERVVAALEDKK